MSLAFVTGVAIGLGIAICAAVMFVMATEERDAAQPFCDRTGVH